jgi:hypothetical protein
MEEKVKLWVGSASEIQPEIVVCVDPKLEPTLMLSPHLWNRAIRGGWSPGQFSAGGVYVLPGF